LEPELSVVIATHNRRQMLGRCIEALAGQKQDPRTFEVVVGDDGSADGTVEMLKGLEPPFRLTALDLGKVGKAAARNAAIEAARGRICLVLDDDVIAEADLVAEHLAAHREGPIVGIGRLTQSPPEGRDWYASAFAATWNEHFDRLEDRAVEWSDAYAGNLSAPREALLEVGGFRERPVGDDFEIGYLLAGAGCETRYLARAHAVHDDRKDRDRLVAESMRQGAGHLDLLEEYPEMLPRLYGWFGATSRREVALRRFVLALRVQPRLLARLGGLLPGRGRRMIWFHFVSRYAFWRGVRGAVDRERWERLTRGVPVLMYHAFGAQDEGDRYVISRRALSRQLRLLKLFGYRGVEFVEVARCLRRGELPPRRAVAITIDDGYRDNLEVAEPVLRRYGFSATVFLVSEKLGGVNDWTTEGALADRPLLTSDQVDELRGRGISLGAHTRRHPELPALGDQALKEEVAGSREDLEPRFGEIATFAYPFGLFDERAVATAEEAGFEGACTVEPRLVSLLDDPLRMPRVEVRAGESLPRFLLNVWLGAR
jgi:GT2 family glycosyltransferase/peptidoglycan/xylan/chitin deacetylase (PgdA/CDA1 family)